ncbi:MAG: contact-dependent growth inhibition system immunity protein [Lachnospiraceae bacterium]|nr:contact-dependent growth inhibition system immunity protein [Lachnospiraceae bacterium]
MEKKIKDLYNISFNLDDISNEDRCQMHDWYNTLINKTYDQINLFDVTRMLIQKVFMELAVPKSIKFIDYNPFCGQRYEGELMELLSKLNLDYFDHYRDDMLKILSKALFENKTYKWICEEEREEFSKLLNSFLIKFSG